MIELEFGLNLLLFFTHLAGLRIFEELLEVDYLVWKGLTAWHNFRVDYILVLYS